MIKKLKNIKNIFNKTEKKSNKKEKNYTNNIFKKINMIKNMFCLMITIIKMRFLIVLFKSKFKMKKILILREIRLNLE